MASPLLFDMDGTIVDSIELIVQAADYAFGARSGPAPTRPEWLALIGTPLDAMLRRWSMDEEDLKGLWARYREFQVEHHDRLVTAYPGVVALIKRLHERGHPMAIVSSKFEPGILRNLDFIGLTHCFPVLVGLEATEKHKPEPDPVWYAVEKLGGKLEDAWFIGDSPHDIHSGNAAGVRTIGVLSGPYDRASLESARPTHIVERITEIEALLG